MGKIATMDFQGVTLEKAQFCPPANVRKEACAMGMGLVTKRLFQHPRELGQFARLFVSGSAFAAMSIS
jgi:hypothetical protein